ncbi:MAG: hypothetical protein EWV81_09135 [Microcystis aeruginosa Ma_SC_T_19800800_S464]|jgi:hypothetical protein|uniref:Uncharacterized protein n=1 Tax=Microcystis aeruginosa Ma_SC_T_19800800_S464 TaxID=2486257 RepID=A0A552DX84_MICAE|nr:MAG: hypothetical protein EWV81_09135 [Microcystis aeruginosa Ma_SC_T_19800800_S464]
MSNQKLKKIINYHLSKVLEYNAFERFEGVTDKSSFLNMIGNDPAFAPFFLNDTIVISDKSNTSYTDKALSNSSIDILNLN